MIGQRKSLARRGQLRKKSDLHDTAFNAVAVVAVESTDVCSEVEGGRVALFVMSL